jgi:hypothetical protein
MTLDPLADVGLAARVDQYTAGGSYPHSDCGESSVLSVLIDFGHPRPMAAVERMARRHGDVPSDGTHPPAQAACLRENGVPAEVVWGRPRDVMPPALARGRRLIWDVAADLLRSPLSHAIVVDACDADGVHFMDPSGGLYRHISWQRLEVCSRDVGVLVTAPVPVVSGGLRSVDLQPPVHLPSAGMGAILASLLAAWLLSANPAAAGALFLMSVGLALALHAAVQYAEHHPRLRLVVDGPAIRIDGVLRRRLIDRQRVGRGVIVITGAPGRSAATLELIDRSGALLAALPVAPEALRPAALVLRTSGIDGGSPIAVMSRPPGWWLGDPGGGSAAH